MRASYEFGDMILQVCSAKTVGNTPLTYILDMDTSAGQYLALKSEFNSGVEAGCSTYVVQRTPDVEEETVEGEAAPGADGDPMLKPLWGKTLLNLVSMLFFSFATPQVTSTAQLPPSSHYPHSHPNMAWICQVHSVSG